MKRVFKFFKWMMIVLFSIVVIVAAITFFYMRQAKFGGKPEGKRLAAMEASSHFKAGVFENKSHTPTLTEGYSMMGILSDQLFKKMPRKEPKDTIPSTKKDLKSLKESDNVLVWFGHSSYFMQIDGKRILVDPVFSGSASPVPGTVKAFAGTDRYKVSDLPDIDYLFISHDHYDHLDYETIKELKDHVKHVICGLGVGAHFERWGYSEEQIEEKDWYESVTFDSGFDIYMTPTRHFSGRGFKRNNTLWGSYVLKTPTKKVYIGGDSGYDTHFKNIGEKYGPFDLAFMENGQYNIAWHAIHMLPHETLMAAKDLGAKRIFPVHSSKFALAMHAWDEPLKELKKLNASEGYNIPMITPIIGQLVNLDDETATFNAWWEGVE